MKFKNFKLLKRIRYASFLIVNFFIYSSYFTNAKKPIFNSHVLLAVPVLIPQRSHFMGSQYFEECRFESIYVWYTEFGYPVKAYDSGSVKAGIWNLEINVDTITGFKADKLNCFFIFCKDKAGTWPKTSGSGKVQIRTGNVSGLHSEVGNPRK